MRIAESAAGGWPNKHGAELLAAAKRDLWDGWAAPLRASQLAAQPCPLDQVLQMALFLGIEPTTHPHLLWIAHAALVAEDLPPGWASAKDEAGEPYYWNHACGLTQWDHPTVAFLYGVAARLLKG